MRCKYRMAAGILAAVALGFGVLTAEAHQGGAGGPGYGGMGGTAGTHQGMGPGAHQGMGPGAYQGRMGQGPHGGARHQQHGAGQGPADCPMAQQGAQAAPK